MELKKKDSLRKAKGCRKCNEQERRPRRSRKDTERKEERRKVSSAWKKRKKAKEAVFTETRHSSEEECKKPLAKIEKKIYEIIWGKIK